MASFSNVDILHATDYAQRHIYEQLNGICYIRHSSVEDVGVEYDHHVDWTGCHLDLDQ